MLTAETLEGVWALVPTPWDDADNLDEDALRHDVSYLCRSGVHGLYTTASSGEFYAMDDQEFQQLVRVVLDEAGKCKIPVQICCGATDTRSFLRRANFAAEAGAVAIQVILPFYVELTFDEAVSFMEEVAETCGQTPLVHYNTSYAKLTFEAEDYQRLSERVPSLIGTKLVKSQPLWFTTVCQKVPQLSHFTGEYTFVADFSGGARGIYSWIAVTNPGLTLCWYQACKECNWNEAIRIQRLVNLYKIHVKLHWHGLSDAAVNKADAMVNTNIRCGLRVRKPYNSCLQEDVDRARRWAQENFPELLTGRPLKGDQSDNEE